MVAVAARDRRGMGTAVPWRPAGRADRSVTSQSPTLVGPSVHRLKNVVELAAFCADQRGSRSRSRLRGDTKYHRSNFGVCFERRPSCRHVSPWGFWHGPTREARGIILKVQESESESNSSSRIVTNSCALDCHFDSDTRPLYTTQYTTNTLFAPFAPSLKRFDKTTTQESN